MANKELGLLTNYLQYDTYTNCRAVLTLLTDKQQQLISEKEIIKVHSLDTIKKYGILTGTVS